LHLTHQKVFGGSVVKRSHGYTHDRLVDGVPGA
jgi:hypothetical protein